MLRLALLLSLAALPACSWVGIRSRPQQRWIGPVTPTTTGPLCTASTGVLLLRENEVVFTPDEGTWTLTGKATADGDIEASQSHKPSGSKEPYNTVLKAHYTESEVHGTYTTPRCTYQVTLTQH